MAQQPIEDQGLPTSCCRPLICPQAEMKDHPARTDYSLKLVIILVKTVMGSVQKNIINLYIVIYQYFIVNSNLKNMYVTL